jgi:ubiquinone/menaquinone biosynthesis C-methylase UbiE
MTEAVEFTDPRLVAVYDTLNPYEPVTQPDFYGDLAAELSAVTIVDLGCGTGMITCALAARGYTVIGADPAPAMVALARRRCGGAGATFIDGGAERLGSPDADLAIMTGRSPSSSSATRRGRRP